MDRNSKGRFIGGNGYWKGKKLTIEAKKKMSLARIGKSPWNKGKPNSEATRKKISLANTGRKVSEETKKKLRGRTEDKSCHWKGDKAGKYTIHRWIEKWKGQPSLCEICGTTKAKKFEWANVNHTYKRVLDDYIRMCTSCHRKFDIKNNNYQSGFNKKNV